MDNDERLLIIGLIVVAILSLIVVLPYWIYLLSSLIIAFVSFPIYKRIKRKLKNENIAALLTLILVFMIVILPFSYIATNLIMQTLNVLTMLQSSSFNETALGKIEEKVSKFTGTAIDFRAYAKSLSSRFNGFLEHSIPSVASKLGNISVGIFLMFFTMFYIFKDGESFLKSLKSYLPLKEKHKEYLITEMSKTLWAITLGHFLTALIQGFFAYFGFLIFGIPNSLFWGFVMLILALIPMIGPFLLYLPFGLFYILIGKIWIGIGLLLYGIIVVNNIDNLVRPKLIHRKINRIHPILIFLGVVGGISVFGVIGIFVGPLILTLMVTLSEVYRKIREENSETRVKDGGE